MHLDIALQKRENNIASQIYFGHEKAETRSVTAKNHRDLDKRTCTLTAPNGTGVNKSNIRNMNG